MNPERRPIQRLSEATVQRIAAGEVVERPASVVKELVENAVDAGATEVRVRLEEGGLAAIVVDDDGAGIRAEELPLAVERHATSKLARPEDLDIVSTLGFRGEALAAIGAVARLRIVSRVPDADEAHGLSMVAGTAVGTFVAGRAPGTTVEVLDLFFNTPARRKFLRAPAAEQVEVSSTLEHLFLARPSVGLTLTNEHGEVARYPPSPSLKDAAARVLGQEFLTESFEVRSALSDGVDVQGRLARPALTRSTAASLYLAVNGRFVQSRLLVQAVRQAYAEYLPKGRYPMGVLHLAIDPVRVDVNVHPTKREVRIAREREVADGLRSAVRTALRAAPHASDRPHATAAPEFPSSISGDAGAGDFTSTADGMAPATGVQQRLDQGPASVRVEGTARHPALRIVGPVFDLYWLAESEGAMVLVDQHAASERVLYDLLRDAGRLTKQELLEPVRVALSGRQAQTLAAHAEDVQRAGFDVEPFGVGAFRVRSVPSYRGRRVGAEQLVALLDELASEGRPTVPDGLQERIDASIACHAAIRAGDVISPDEMHRVLVQLYQLAGASYACPHGRPILIQFPRGRVDRWFLRSPA